MRIHAVIVLCLCLAGCAHVATPADTPVRHVLVVINSDSSDSREIGNYYVEKRNVPTDQVCRIRCTVDETIPVKDFDAQIAAPIRAFVARKELDGRIDYIVLTRGIPIKVEGSLPEGEGLAGPRSVDSLLTCLDNGLRPDKNPWLDNPYFKMDEPFSHKKFGIYLVTRLAAYNVPDAKDLIDHALAATPERSLFLFDVDPNRDNESFGKWNKQMIAASEALEKHRFDVEVDKTDKFVTASGLMGYASWGSNDGHYDWQNYKKLSFSPGGIAETYVSTSARSFVKQKEGQSEIGDLIAGGCTGVKGYVSEPYVVACCDVSNLFDRYTRGYNLAESFYAASPFIYWKDLVVGDPLCRPYPKL